METTCKLFIKACKEGRLIDAQWMYSLQNVQWTRSLNDLDDLWNKSFENACINNHLDVAQWLFSQCNINIHHNNEYFFRLSCACGCLEIVQWIFSQGNVDINNHTPPLLKYTYGHYTEITIKSDNTDILQFLLECGMNIHAKNNNLLLLEYSSWKNKSQVYELLLPYCVESDYDLLDQNILKDILLRPKNARKI